VIRRGRGRVKLTLADGGVGEGGALGAGIKKDARECNWSEALRLEASITGNRVTAMDGGEVDLPGKPEGATELGGRIRGVKRI